jgi:quercetin dioxygenase-like cupin family protein
MVSTVVARAPGQGKTLWNLSSLYEVKVSGDETAGSLTAMEMTIPPGSRPPPCTNVFGSSLYVLEGEVRCHLDGAIHEFGAGTFIYIPPGVEETYEAAGGATVRLLVLYTPGNRMDEFFAEVCEPAPQHALPPASDVPLDLQAFADTARRYGMDIKVPGASQ